jgi:hypothetical protein
MSDAYESDILLWSERQAQLLRRLAAGERVNDLVDWENVIEEVESVGSEQLHAVESLLLQALVHMLKAQGCHSRAMRRIGVPMRVAFARRLRTGLLRPCGGSLIWPASIARRSGHCRKR